MKDMLYIGIALIILIFIFIPENVGFNGHSIYVEKAQISINKSYTDKFGEENTECTCNGSGFIKHGDGHQTKCPCENCKCEVK